jgi:hypothetical protein
MTNRLVLLTRVLMVASLAVTVAKLTTDRGGGQYLLTLIAFVLLSTAAPYWLARKTMERVSARWALAVGAAICLFGIADITLRTKGFFFPTDAVDGAMAFWLPLYSVIAIPLATVIVHTFLTAFAPPEATERSETEKEGRLKPAPTNEKRAG